MGKTVSVVAHLAVVLTVTLSGSRLKAEFPQLRLEVVTFGELVSPVALTNAGDGSNRLFAVDQRGTISIIENGAVLPRPFLDIESKLVPPRTDAGRSLRFDERGLLSLAFHPQFDTVGAVGCRRSDGVGRRSLETWPTKRAKNAVKRAVLIADC